ncbi:hypothetical protein KIN20_033891 [Parelaphostrongylus tenuis]|uniref:Phosphoribulokinase/uridine kinase domain-containing protein n=1 Tax=Parelaphostrongylus tenuis TaxID=148309 RepID=A0AAD5R9D8_PARTN|nr:hypothetical protein KIN20_033891 [Parelaphostrongylus tenuis]
MTSHVEVTSNHNSDDCEPSTGRVLAIAGCTNAGKTTMAAVLTKMFAEEGVSVATVHQDDFFHTKEKMEKVWRKNGSQPSFFYNFDSTSAIDLEKMVRSIKTNILCYDYVIVEGNMLTEWPDVVDLCDRIIFLTLDAVNCLSYFSQQ